VIACFVLGVPLQILGSWLSVHRKVEARDQPRAAVNSSGTLFILLLPPAFLITVAVVAYRRNRRDDRGVRQALALWKAGDPGGALPLLIREALDDPWDLSRRCNLCQLLGELGRTDDARAQLQSIEDLHRQVRVFPPEAGRLLADQVQRCRDLLAAKPKADPARFDEPRS
jgi:hypothetical protein